MEEEKTNAFQKIRNAVKEYRIKTGIAPEYLIIPALDYENFIDYLLENNLIGYQFGDTARVLGMTIIKDERKILRM